MRIGILTFHKAINYGAYLQAFSLSRKLQEQFPKDTVEIIDYIAPKEQRRKPYVVLRNIKRHGVEGGLSELKRIVVFRSVQKHLPRSPEAFGTRNLNKLYAYIDERYDLLIIGSDAVFNWNQTEFPTAFIPDYPFSIPVCTYAASVHGLRFHDEPDERLQKCGKVFGLMELVGVRDKCSEDFVKLCSRDAKTIHCCDPTLFIDKDELYRKGISVRVKLEKKHGFSIDSKYIVVMAPDSPMIEAISKRYGKDYKIVSVFTRSLFSDFYISDLNPFEWAVVLRNAQVVVTSYFHGTLLSLVQGTPAIVLDYSGYCDEPYEGKLKDLMVTRFGLPELYFDQDYAAAFRDDEAFYKKVDELIQGKYRERIEAAVSNERMSLSDFVQKIKLIDCI